VPDPSLGAVLIPAADEGISIDDSLCWIKKEVKAAERRLAFRGFTGGVGVITSMVKRKGGGAGASRVVVQAASPGSTAAKSGHT